MGEAVQRTCRKEIGRVRTAQDLKENRDLRWFEGGIIDEELSAPKSKVKLEVNIGVSTTGDAWCGGLVERMQVLFEERSVW